MSGSPEGPETVSSRLKRVPVSTWIGIGGTALAALIGLASGGFWSMLLMVAIILLITTIYGVAFRRHTWIRLPRRRSAAAIGLGIAFAVFIGSTSAYGASHPLTPELAAVAATVKPAAQPRTSTPTSSTKSEHTPTPTPTPTPVVTTSTVTETVAVPFTSSTVQSGAMAAGTSAVTTPGVNGVETKTYTVTYTDGAETGRVLTGDSVTTPPVTQVTTQGTYVAPAPAPAPAPSCTNGTYVNSAGNTVCSPEQSVGAPAGATAQCRDGSYSFSQSRSGTCSSHGGVAAWL